MFYDHSKRNPTWLHHKGSYQCGGNRCSCCRYMSPSNQFESFTNHKMFNINGYINCNTSHVVYLISCNLCRVQYVGCTVQKLKQRFRRHVSDTNLIHRRQDYTMSAVTHHCIEKHAGSTASSDGSSKGKDTIDVRFSETYWIFTFSNKKSAMLNSMLLICFFIYILYYLIMYSFVLILLYAFYVFFVCIPSSLSCDFV